MLEFNTAFEKDILVIELEGSLDSTSAADFRDWFAEKMRAGYRAFAIDCLCLEYISSAGISAIIDLQNSLANKSGKMVLFQLSSETRQLMRFLQLEQKLHLVGEYDDAIAALTGVGKVNKDVAPAGAAPALSGVEAMVDAGEIRVLPEEAGHTEDPNAMHVEEQLSPEKRGLHPVGASARSESPTAAKPQPAAAPKAPESPARQAPAAPATEAQEIKIQSDARRLISCPNCKNVLRVSAAGEYLCPSCRFRFSYKGAAG
jgi:anti-anti-sigma factor